VAQEELDGARGVALAAGRREEEVADVDLSGAEPVVPGVGVVVDPADELVVHPDTRDGRGSRGARPEPALELLVATGDELSGVARRGRAEGHDSVGGDHRRRRDIRRS
jgi:hypothetical protein